jgi:hypothetical protein
MPLIPPDPEIPELQDPASSLSKRATRRIIQRTFVLMGKDKVLRQLIRESRLTTVWAIEDWDFEWSVYINRGKFEFERRQSKHPDVTLTWPTAELFFAQVDHFRDASLSAQITPPQTKSHLLASLLRGFFTTLRQVLENPVDAVGQSLL